ncbi:hypothetical protein BJ165DRAFT_1525371 [Panaeolus papilionaceus]|nr:hypothetical protein BJ165DRAFT_1525371 [Panaeolus papilionaceus]
MATEHTKQRLREMSETVDGTDESEDYIVVGRVSPDSSFVGSGGFAPEGSDLAGAEYLVTLCRPNGHSSMMETMYARDFDQKLKVVRDAQQLYAKGKDAEFLLVHEQGSEAFRLRRLVFHRKSSHNSHKNVIAAWPFPHQPVRDKAQMAAIYDPIALPCFNKEGARLRPEDVDSVLPDCLARVTFVIRHLAVSRGLPGDVMDLYMGVIKKIECLE